LGLEIEEQRTNLLTYSEQFGNAAWTKSASSITANTIVAPDGTMTADKIVATATTGYFSVFQAISVISGNSYTKTVYAKAGEWRYAFLQVGGTSWTSQGQNSGIRFDLISGTVAGAYNGQSSANGAITSVGNGWYRISARWDCNTTTSLGSVLIGLTNTNNEATNTGNGFNGIFVWGAQLEVGAFATSYIQTVASQVTRAADVASMTGANFSSWYNAAEGTMYAEYIYSSGVVGNAQSMYSISDGGETNRLIAFRTSALTQQFDETGGGGSIVTGAALANTPYRSALAYRVNDMAVSISGAATVADTSVTISAKTQLAIGDRATGGRSLNGTIRKIAYYPLRVSNANLQALTS
jgi:hypothetical protein